MHTLLHSSNPATTPMVIADISAESAIEKMATRTNNLTGWYVRTLLPDGKTRIRPLSRYLTTEQPHTAALPR